MAFALCAGGCPSQEPGERRQGLGEGAADGTERGRLGADQELRRPGVGKRVAGLPIRGLAHTADFSSCGRKTATWDPSPTEWQPPSL